MYYLYVFTLIFGIIIYIFIKKQREIFEYFIHHIDHERFRHICKEYLLANETNDTDRALNVLESLIYMIRGKVKYQSVKYNKDASEICPICREDINKEDDIIILPCGHFGKKECIETWLTTSVRCMLCNRIS